MSVGARMSEFARRHTGTPWGRRDCHVPAGWTRAIQACLPSDDRSAARSLFRRCRLRPALGKLEISTSPSSEEDHGKRLEAQAWVGLTRDFFPSVRICRVSLTPWHRWLRSCVHLHKYRLSLSQGNSIAVHKSPYPSSPPNTKEQR